MTWDPALVLQPPPVPQPVPEQSIRSWLAGSVAQSGIHDPRFDPTGSGPIATGETT